MKEYKSGFVTIIGKTNVGKSTLLNSLVSEKVAAIAPKPQTTRTVIKAIVNRESSQIIFIDTPGIHKPKNKLGEVMLDTTFDAIKEVDIILFIIEATNKQIDKGDQIILDKLKDINKKTILIINKIDLIKKEEMLKLIKIYSDEYSFSSVIPMCATKNKGVETLLLEIEKLLPIGPAYYDKEQYTDQTIKQLIEEIVREKALILLQDEVPHGLYVEVEKVKKKKTIKKENIFDIDCIIYCIRDSHKGIIIGKNGQMLKRIGRYARIELENMLNEKVNLNIWVKVDKNWQEKDSVVKKFKPN